MRGAELKRAVLVGVVIAAALLPAFAFERLVEMFVTDRAEASAVNETRKVLAQIEQPIRRATEALEGLAVAGIGDCDDRAVAAMQAAVSSTVAVKEIGLVDGSGALLCMQRGFPADHRALTAEQTAAGGRVTIAVVEFGDARARALRVRRTEGPPFLAAVIPVEVFAPKAGDGREPGTGARVVVAGMPFAADMPGDIGPRDVHVIDRSNEFPLSVELVRPFEAVKAAWGSLVLYARLAGLLITGFTLALSWVLDTRRRNEPMTQIAQALDDGEFIPYYQPIVDINDGSLLGCEVLVRWRRPDGEIVSPGAFIHHFEQSSLVIDLTLALMRAARDDLTVLFGTRPNLYISFNIHADHFLNNQIVTDVERVFHGSPLEMSQLLLEVTERTPLADLDAARRCIEMLQRRGLRVAIDDVGTGHGGLSYLLKLGVDVIKIDKMFIDALGSERYSSAIIETLVELARQMRMGVVAEGVETEAQVHALQARGIHAAQGYVFAPPLPGPAFVRLVEAMHPRMVPMKQVEEAPPRRPNLRYASLRGRRFAS